MTENKERATRKLQWMDTCMARAKARARGCTRADKDETGEWRRAVKNWLCLLKEQGIKYKDGTTRPKLPGSIHDGSCDYYLENGEVYLDCDPL